MRQYTLHIITFLFISAFAHSSAVGADNTVSGFDKYVRSVYDDFKFKKAHTLDYEVFKKGYIGYLNLKQEGKLSADKQILTICDLSMSSNEKRMWILDIATRKILLNTYVAHGQGTGNEYANKFSNIPNSHQSSMGFYVTGATYLGKHGNSLRLTGMDEGYNCNAMDRAIVIHGAEYVSEDFIRSHKRLGRSWGCPAVSVDVSDDVINYIKEGTCLFMYFPQEQYLADSYWLNKQLEINKISAPKQDERTPMIQDEENAIDRVLKYEFPLSQ